MELPLEIHSTESGASPASEPPRISAVQENGASDPNVVLVRRVGREAPAVSAPVAAATSRTEAHAVVHSLKPDPEALEARKARPLPSN
jgi:hypothetical protein